MSATDSGISVPPRRTQTVQPQPIPPEQPINVRLAAQQWDYVLRLLSEVAAPLRMTLPIVRDIETQCLAANNAALEELPDA